MTENLCLLHLESHEYTSVLQVFIKWRWTFHYHHQHMLAAKMRVRTNFDHKRMHCVAAVIIKKTIFITLTYLVA